MNNAKEQVFFIIILILILALPIGLIYMVHPVQNTRCEDGTLQVLVQHGRPIDGEKRWYDVPGCGVCDE